MNTLCSKEYLTTLSVLVLWEMSLLFQCDDATLRWLRLLLKCDGTRAETRICFSAKRTSPFKSAGASVQSTTDSRGVRISGSNAGYTKFRGSEGYWLPTPSATFLFTSPPVRHRVPSRFNWTLPCVTFPCFSHCWRRILKACSVFIMRTEYAYTDQTALLHCEVQFFVCYIGQMN